jgi:heme oxygenase
MNTSSTLSEQLRQITGPLHEKLDHAPLLSEVMSESLTDETYAKVIGKMYECFRIVENAAFEAAGSDVFSKSFYESRLDFLKEDFKAMGSKKIDENCTPELKPAPASLDAAVGMLYVLHGSSMGGQMIARKLKSRIPSAALNFYSQSEHFAKNWRPFKEKLDANASNFNINLIAEGADWAFDVFYRVFTHG